MKNERYYYGILPKEEKVAYQIIYYGIIIRALNIIVPVYLSQKQIQNVYLKVLYDNPIFFYINQTVIRMTGEAGYYILILLILVYTLFSRMFDLMQSLAVKHSIAVV